MMIHRKNTHEGVKMCKNYLNNTCQRDMDCWWKHNNNPEQDLDFQQSPENLAPPIQSQIEPIMHMENWPPLPPLPGQINQTMPKMIQILE